MGLLAKKQDKKINEEALEEIHSKFAEFMKMGNGWTSDGYGTAFSPDWLNHVYRLVEENYPLGLPVPIVTPVGDGGVLFEWEYGKTNFSLDISSESLADIQTAQFLIVDMVSGSIQSQDIDITSVEDWEIIVKYVLGK